MHIPKKLKANPTKDDIVQTASFLSCLKFSKFMGRIGGAETAVGDNDELLGSGGYSLFNRISNTDSYF
jgi:hypothetical protein